MVKHTNINGISTSSTQLPNGHPLSAVTMPSTFYYTHDGLGSVRTLTAHTLNQIASAPVFPASPSTAPPRATGIASHHDYLSFGECHNLSTQSLFGNRYNYTGRELRPSANDIFYRHRNYQPWSGRFASRDPLRFIDGPNIYEYVGSRPNDFIDPYGLGQTAPQPPRQSQPKNPRQTTDPNTHRTNSSPLVPEGKPHYKSDI